MVHAALLLLMLEVVTRTSFHHQPEAQHPKSPAIYTPAGRLPHLLGCPPGLLPRALERRRLRPLLDADADRVDVELREIGSPFAPPAHSRASGNPALNSGSPLPRGRAE